jgi:hypothetical protein
VSKYRNYGAEFGKNRSSKIQKPMSKKKKKEEE